MTDYIPPPIKQLTLDDLGGIEMVCQEQMRVIARIVRMSFRPEIEIFESRKSCFLDRLFKKKKQPITYTEEEIQGVGLLVEHCTYFIHWVNYLVSTTRNLHREDISQEDWQHAKSRYDDTCQEIEDLLDEISASDYHGNKYVPSALRQIQYINLELLRDPPFQHQYEQVI